MYSDLNAVFNNASQNLVTEYAAGSIILYSEADLQCHLFSQIANILRAERFPLPLLVFAEKSVRGFRGKIDLVLGNDEVLAELKLESDYPGVGKPVVFSTDREAGGSGSVEGDLRKIAEYARRGKHAHFIMIDEDGRHVRKIEGDWRSINRQGKTVYYLHTYVEPILGPSGHSGE